MNEISTRKKYQIVLDALECGLEVKLGDVTILMGEDEQHRPVPCFKTYNMHDSNDVRLVEYDISIKHLMAECERLTDDEIAMLVANTTLNAV